MSGNATNQELIARIIRLVHERWEHRRLPLLLSQLGVQGGTELTEATKRVGMTVKQYVKTRLSDDIQVIQDPTRTQLVAAVPKSVDVESEGGVERLLERTRRPSTSTIPRYNAAFWAAFRTPLAKEKRRYVTDQEPIEFRDITASEEHFGQEIDREFILEGDSEPSQVARRIRNWVDRYGVDSVIYERKSSPRKDHNSDPKSLLDQMLDCLEPGELQRVTMPLDVILKLKKQLS